MPLTPTPLKDRHDEFLKDEIEVRLAEKVYEQPNWFTGKKTYIGLAIMLIAAIASRFNVKVPTQDISNFMALLEQNWDLLVEIFGGLVMIVGLIAKQFRHEKEKEVIKEVAKDALVETAVAAVVVAEAKKDLIVKEIELHKTKSLLEKAKQQ